MTTKKYNGIDLPIPLIDLASQYLQIKNDIDSSIQECLEESDFIEGKRVRSFEHDFSRYLGVGHTVSCGNGTDSMEIILQALGIGPGDEVIVPAFTWISTSEVVENVGATPVFVDVLPGNACMDPDKVKEALNSRTKAIICVHLYGQTVELDKLLTLSERSGVPLIEDCAQAHGTTYSGKKVGNFGLAASFSFYPGKNLGAYGDGGAIYTHDQDLAEKCRMIANHGQKTKHRHIIRGRNSRLDAIQAAVLSVKLPHLPRWIERKREIALTYREKLSGNPDLNLPEITAGHSFHLFVIRTSARDKLKDHLASKGIQTSIHYPKALPFQEVYASFGCEPQDYPVAYEWQQQALSLPMFAELSEDQLEYITSSIKSFYRT